MGALLAALLGAWTKPTHAAPDTLVFAVDASTHLPWAELQDNELRRGIHRDLGEALSAQLGLQTRFLVLPRKRIAERLEQGQADIACAYLPQWLAGPFDWSEPFLPDTELILSLRSAAMPRQLLDLAGKPIGTVNGFFYPELQKQLGAGFVREDGPTMDANLRKLEAGRMQYAVASQLFVDYQRRSGGLKLDLHPDFKVSQLAMACALSRRSELKLDRLNRAIAEFSASGAWGRLLARYR
ncbi:substrate-binding periplasmic protein [Paucibacter sp. Y2R2-4]|uniref:substrate-binding periplasmic protein n=1 Tax=Paucibacter sp. Y2R2-4 TaxID=2893553 RepID=UPI0021E48195|nr:transporter substrate-binding domain-containing protein [Paucibacter sp. Y2R2-4]MCV2351487.1 transporter substrate-binding domain-containing protein [Paucibacter sp. Y2R2-4]